MTESPQITLESVHEEISNIFAIVADLKDKIEALSWHVSELEDEAEANK
jgi:flavin reductase (DIM6/NTAB) family NADH-FMN oxidoreductase RutF